ncbi:MAG: response regulator [Nitrospira sp.]|nr:response regulator [Nitrospira sp.]
MASILIIDDQVSIRTLLRIVLQGAGHTVREATNGREGVALYRQQQADLVITDIHMPELNGLDLILELTSEFLNVKVIAISGEPGDGANGLHVAKLLGARQVLQKPFDLNMFNNAVEYELAH